MGGGGERKAGRGPSARIAYLGGISPWGAPSAGIAYLGGISPWGGRLGGPLAPGLPGCCCQSGWLSRECCGPGGRGTQTHIHTAQQMHNDND